MTERSGNEVQFVLDDEVRTQVGSTRYVRTGSRFHRARTYRQICPRSRSRVLAFPVDVCVYDVNGQAVRKLARLVGAADEHPVGGHFDDPIVVDREPTAAPGPGFDLLGVSFDDFLLVLTFPRFVWAVAIRSV